MTAWYPRGVDRKLRASLRVLFSFLVLLLPACREDPLAPFTFPDLAPNPSWTEESHGRVPPDYSVVFPPDSVNRIDIVLPSFAWQAIRSDMIKRIGYDFGVPTNSNVPSGNPIDVPANIHFNGKLWPAVGFRLRGNSSLQTAWSLGNYKLPIRLDFSGFRDEYSELEDQRLYGFDEVVLIPGVNDPSFTRERLASDLFRAAGVPAARMAFYRVYLDVGEGLRYIGVYTMAEGIEDTMLQDQLGDGRGSLYGGASRLDVYSAQEFKIVQEGEDRNSESIKTFLTALHSPLRTIDPPRWRNELEATFDVDLFLRWLSANTAMQNGDVYGVYPSNYYLYSHPTRGVLWIPWDFSVALIGITNQPSLSLSEVTEAWPLIRYLADDPVYFGMYREHMRRFAAEIFTVERMDSLSEKYHSMVAPYAVGPGGELPGATYLASAAAFLSSIDYLRTHVRARETLIAEFLR